MKVIKQGQQRLFEQDAETAAVVSRMLIDLEKNGMTRFGNTAAASTGTRPLCVYRRARLKRRSSDAAGRDAGASPARAARPYFTGSRPAYH